MKESKKIPIWLPIVLGLIIIVVGGFWTGYELEKFNNLKFVQNAEVVDEAAFPPNVNERYADFKYVFKFKENGEIKQLETELYPHRKFRIGEKDEFYYDQRNNEIVQYPILNLTGVIFVFFMGLMSFLLAFTFFVKDLRAKNVTFSNFQGDSKE